MAVLPITAFPRELSANLFQTNEIPSLALQADPRVSYAAYIPDEHYPQSPTNKVKLPLLVAVHGTHRRHSRCLATWKDFAIKHKCAIIAPLFPAMLQTPTDLDGYHYLGRPPQPDAAFSKWLDREAVEVPMVYASFSTGDDTDLRYDLLLLAMVEEVSLRWPAIDSSKFLLTGFPGGGQFVHRFMYLHHERLLGASVGAPGSVTRLDDSTSWPMGTRDIEAVFGKKIDMDGLRGLSILASVGGDDVKGDASKTRRSVKGSVLGDEIEVNKTRVRKLKELVENWRENELNVELVAVPGVAHDMEKVNPPVEAFMSKRVAQWHQDHSPEGCRST